MADVVKSSGGEIGKGCGDDDDDDDVMDEEEECCVAVVEEAMVSAGAKTENGIDDSPSSGPPRLVILSNKVKNSSSIHSALYDNVMSVTFKYETTSLDGLLGLVAQQLGSTKVQSIALLLHSSVTCVYLCGKDEKTITKETILEQQSVREFFITLVENHIDRTWVNARLDFLQCNVGQVVDGGLIAREIEEFLHMPVGLSKELSGADIPMTWIGDEGHSYQNVGSLYFAIDKVKSNGSSQQSLAGFEKIRTVGKGAYGAAVLYRKKDDDSLVILKEINMHDLNAGERTLALNEIKVLAMLDHPNIISYYDSFEEDGTLMIEMEYADGGNLAQFLAGRDKPLEEKEILTIMQQLVAAIRHIHEHNILHRDLKTANIFLTKDGIVKVGDFGIAKMLTTANKGANTVLGTPYYISPEMCEGKAYNDKSDVWALGCIMYEMACLQKTFEGSNLPALVNKIMKGQFAPVKGNYRSEFKNLIKDMLEREPQYRPTAHELWNRRLPELLLKYNDPHTDNEDDLASSTDGNQVRKKIRSVLYYLETDDVNLMPIELPPKIKIRQVAISNDHTIVVTNERSVYSWGEGSKGQLGHGDLEPRYNPQLVEALNGKSITKACCGDGFSLFSSDNGIVMTCGDGTKGCLGHGDWCSTARPRLIEALLSVDVSAVDCGKEHVVIVGSQGQVYSWGQGAAGRLGHGNEEDCCEPKEVVISEPVKIRDVCCGDDGTMLLTDVGSLLAFGSNQDNKLGLNHRQGFLMAMKNIFNKNEVEGAKSPCVVRAMARHCVTSISMASTHSAVLVESGHVYTFGRNTEGQLGTGNNKAQNAPIEVKTLSDKIVLRVQCTDTFTVVSTKEGELMFWGTLYKSHTTNSATDDSHKTSDTSAQSAPVQHVQQRSSTSSISSLNNSGGHKDKPGSASSTSRQSNFMPEMQNETVTGEHRVHDRQASVDSNVSSASGGALDTSQSSKYHGFRPSSSTPRRPKSSEGGKDDGEIQFFKPNTLLMMEKVQGEESISLSSFYCHGTHIFVQVETTAPFAPPRRRRSRRKAFSKSQNGSQLEIPTAPTKLNSASSRDAGSEYSSDTSELDTYGTIPAWIQQELSAAKGSHEQPIDDVDGQSSEEAEDGATRLNESFSSIQLNRDLKRVGQKAKPKIKKALPLTSESGVECTPVEDLSSSSLDSEIEEIIVPKKSEEAPNKKLTTIPAGRKLTGASPYKSKVMLGGGQTQKPLNRLRAQNKGRGRGTEQVQSNSRESDSPVPRGLLSEVTHRRREDAIQQELERLKAEKAEADQKIKDMQRQQQQQAEIIRRDAEIKAKEREQQLEKEVLQLRTELLQQSNKMQDNYNVVIDLQEQLLELKQEQLRINAREQRAKSAKSQQSVQKDSKICVLS